MMFPCVFVTFPYGVPGQVRYLIVSITDTCFLLYLLFCVFPVLFFARIDKSKCVIQNKYFCDREVLHILKSIGSAGFDHSN